MKPRGGKKNFTAKSAVGPQDHLGDGVGQEKSEKQPKQGASRVCALERGGKIARTMKWGDRACLKNGSADVSLRWDIGTHTRVMVKLNGGFGGRNFKVLGGTR